MKILLLFCLLFTFASVQAQIGKSSNDSVKLGPACNAEEQQKMLKDYFQLRGNILGFYNTLNSRSVKEVLASDLKEHNLYFGPLVDSRNKPLKLPVKSLSVKTNIEKKRVLMKYPDKSLDVSLVDLTKKKINLGVLDGTLLTEEVADQLFRRIANILMCSGNDTHKLAIFDSDTFTTSKHPKKAPADGQVAAEAVPQ